MPTTRITEGDRRILQELAARSGKQQQQILHEALDAYRRAVFLAAVNEGFAKLREDPGEWRAELDERRQWEGTLEDGADE